MQYKEQAIDPPDGPEIADERVYLAWTTDSDVSLYVSVQGGQDDLTYQPEFKITAIEWSDEEETWQDPELIAIKVRKFGEPGSFRIPADFLDSDTIQRINEHLEKEVAKGNFISGEEL